MIYEHRTWYILIFFIPFYFSIFAPLLPGCLFSGNSFNHSQARLAGGSLQISAAHSTVDGMAPVICGWVINMRLEICRSFGLVHVDE